MKMVIRTAAAAAALAGLVWFCIPISYNVLNIGNIFGIAVCAFVLITAVLIEKIEKICKRSKPFRIFCRTVTVLFCICVLWAAVLTGCIVYGSGAFGLRSKPPQGATVVVLGSKVSGTVPSADLRVRLETAASYLKANPQARCIVSGGRGAGELATEASVMQAYLEKQGIDASRITVENQSKTTEENLKNSLAIITKNHWNGQLAIVTDEYHQFRAGRIAQRLGAETYPVCAPTPWYIFSACYMRELLALTEFLIIP